MTLHAALNEQLLELERLGLTRQRRTLEAPCGPLAQVDGQSVISFCSNDYLGLANDPALVEAACAGAKIWGVGSGASHLVSGHQTPHDALERRLAAFTGLARALFFSTGYMANLGLITALAGREAAVFADKLNHASLIDAVQLSRAQSRRYPHGDLARLEALLASSPAKQKLIVTDAVFSMDGDLAPLPELLALAERFNAWLVVDDAHGFGVLGAQGRGSLAHFSLPPSDRLVYMGTLGKAAGASGAFVAGSSALIEWLVQRARTYMFSTGSSPMIACALLASLDLIESATRAAATCSSSSRNCKTVSRKPPQAGRSCLRPPLFKRSLLVITVKRYASPMRSISAVCGFRRFARPVCPKAALGCASRSAPRTSPNRSPR